MSQQRDREENGRSVSSHPQRVLEAFVDGAPRTVTDVAICAGVDEDVARETLETLTEQGELTSRTVRGVDITARKDAEEADLDIDAEIELWSLPVTSVLEGPTEPPEADAVLERRLERMTVPGASSMMLNWRRDAVRAAYEHLESTGGATATELRDELFGSHGAGFDDPGEWWAFVRPRLYRLPGLIVEDDRWTVRPDGEESTGTD
jgi:hypothetical protein